MTAVTVATPTFNRAHFLPRLRESLLAQTFEDFEWLIVDDGSSDGTRDLVATWPEVRYLWQPNAGLKVAWNRAVMETATEFVAVVGSDDWYLPHALERLHGELVGLGERFANVEARTLRPDGQLNGVALPQPIMDGTAFDRLYRWHAHGDTMGMYRAAVAKQFPFEHAESRSGPEGTAFLKLGRHYLTRFLDEAVGVIEYQPGGLASRSRAERLSDPAAWLRYYWEAATFPASCGLRVRAELMAQVGRFAARTAAVRGHLARREVA
jgi:glycosyltransferase involved in cell wall biosynthesis